MLLDELRIKGTASVTRRLSREAAGRSFHGLAGRAILSIRRGLYSKIGIQLGLHGSFGELLDQRCQNTVLAGQVLTIKKCLQSGIGALRQVGIAFGNLLAGNLDGLRPLLDAGYQRLRFNGRFPLSLEASLVVYVDVNHMFVCCLCIYDIIGRH